MRRYGDDFYVSGSNEFVCGKCFDDIDISTFIESGAVSHTCNFCGKEESKPIAVPLDDVVQFMSVAINREYERAVDALGWCSEEGGYLGHHFDSRDLLEDRIGLVLPQDDGRLLTALEDSLGDEPWCQRDPYGMPEDELLITSWERFCVFIKHQRRYFFLQEHTKGPVDSDYLSPSQMLRFVAKNADDCDLVKTLAAGTLVYPERANRSRERVSSRPTISDHHRASTLSGRIE